MDDHGELLRNASALRFVSEDQHAILSQMFLKERYEFGDLIVREGDEADSFFVLVSGRARAIRTTARGEELVLGTLRPGAEIGGDAILEGGLRTASVRCSTSVEVLRLGRAQFLKLMEEHPQIRQSMETAVRFRALHNFLYEFSNFGRLSAPVLRDLVDKLKPASFSKGQMVIREGDPAGPMYVIEKGRVRLFTSSGGRVRNLAFYREGDFFGELSLLTGSPRAASAEALGDCQLFMLSPDAVLELRGRSPEFSKLLEERASQYNKDKEARVPLDFSTELLPASYEALAWPAGREWR